MTDKYKSMSGTTYVNQMDARRQPAQEAQVQGVTVDVLKLVTDFRMCQGM